MTTEIKIGSYVISIYRTNKLDRYGLPISLPVRVRNVILRSGFQQKGLDWIKEQAKRPHGGELRTAYGMGQGSLRELRKALGIEPIKDWEHPRAVT